MIGPFTDPRCTCPHGERPVDHIPTVVRLSTTPECPVHDACQHYAAEYRQGRPDWSTPYCPIHATRDCPPRVANRVTRHERPESR